MEQIELKVAGMTCGSCVSRVKQTLLRVPGVQSAEVDLALGLARVSVDDARTLQPALIEALTASGYPAEPFDTSVGDAKESNKAGAAGGARAGGCCGH